MIRSFDLTSQPWIYAQSKTEAAREFSLREILISAHELQELCDTSPLVTVGTLRLLLAILYRVCAEDGQFMTHNDWLRIREANRFPKASIENYLNKWQPRFNLFDEDFPFYQTAKLEMETPKSINALAAEMVNGNNPALFDHNMDANIPCYTPAQSARFLVGAQSFALAGLLRAKATLDKKEMYHANGFNGAIPPGAAIWVSGENLFETLLYNTVPQRKNEEDAPCWELDPPWRYRDIINSPKVKSKGPMDRFTWQSRLIRLLPEEEDGKITVSACHLTQGRSADTNPDHMHAYYESAKKGKLIVRLSERKASWRDAHAIFDKTADDHRPAVFNFIAKLIDEEDLPRGKMIVVHVAGIANNKAKVMLWRHDTMSIPADLLEDENLELKLKEWMQWANDVEWRIAGKPGYGMALKLQNATRTAVGFYLSPQSDKKADTDTVTSLADSLDPLGLYWSRLEKHFLNLLTSLEYETGGDTASIAERWAKAIGKEAEQAFDQAVIKGLGDSGRALQAIARTQTSWKIDRYDSSESIRYSSRKKEAGKKP